MKITRKKLRTLIREAFGHDDTDFDDFRNELTQVAMSNGGAGRYAQSPYGVNTVFIQEDGCQSIVEYNKTGRSIVHLGTLKTLNAAGVIDPDCYRRGISRRIMMIICDLADDYGFMLTLGAMQIGSLGAPRDALIKFYGSLGFVITDDTESAAFMTRYPS
jgi:GNAT superfamily N-acetyltransferase